MQRAIVGFGRDDQGDWVAHLACGHPQHVRHDPPFFNRPWVATRAGRAATLGRPLNCVRCERLELPLAPRLHPAGPPVAFTESTLPPALRDGRALGPATWGVIELTEGALRYRVDAWDVALTLRPGTPGVLVPEVAARVEPLGPVQGRLALFTVAPPPADPGDAKD